MHHRRHKPMTAIDGARSLHLSPRHKHIHTHATHGDSGSGDFQFLLEQRLITVPTHYYQNQGRFLLMNRSCLEIPATIFAPLFPWKKKLRFHGNEKEPFFFVWFNSVTREQHQLVPLARHAHQIYKTGKDSRMLFIRIGTPLQRVASIKSATNLTNCLLSHTLSILRVG